jgi:hypothetical protein
MTNTPLYKSMHPSTWLATNVKSEKRTCTVSYNETTVEYNVDMNVRQREDCSNEDASEKALLAFVHLFDEGEGEARGISQRPISCRHFPSGPSI